MQLIVALIVEKVGEYPYTLGVVVVNRQIPTSCTHHSRLASRVRIIERDTKQKVIIFHFIRMSNIYFVFLISISKLTNSLSLVTIRSASTFFAHTNCNASS